MKNANCRMKPERATQENFPISPSWASRTPEIALRILVMLAPAITLLSFTRLFELRSGYQVHRCPLLRATFGLARSLVAMQLPTGRRYRWRRCAGGDSSD